MTKVDYSKIASRYDNNPIRAEIPFDRTLDLSNNNAWRVVDLGCGTGLYIASQQANPLRTNIQWIGVDPSPEMLEIARRKVSNVEFLNAAAENLPFDNETIDYVVSRFSFQHFSDQQRALREIHRITRPGGYFKIVNLVPELSPDWWVFKYFPQAIEIDKKRFWSINVQKNEVQAAGFTIAKEELHLREQVPADLIVNEARNRETSELLLIDDDHYREGLARLLRDLVPIGNGLVRWGLMIAEITYQRPPLPAY